MFELHWDDERIEHIAGHGVTIGEVLEVLECEFKDWKDEADFWDRMDTAPLMEEEEGEWLGPGWVQPAPGLCRRCGAQMDRHRADISVAHGRIVLHEVEFYVCPQCGAQTLPPERQEFVVWTEVAVETTARETVVS